jgi:hypothetical protein
MYHLIAFHPRQAWAVGWRPRTISLPIPPAGGGVLRREPVEDTADQPRSFIVTENRSIEQTGRPGDIIIAWIPTR